jgi:hypothetical protein
MWINMTLNMVTSWPSSMKHVGKHVKNI